MTDIMVEIEKRIAPGSLIPKPNTDNEYLVKGWGRRRGKRALIYTIPNLKIPNRPHEKGVTTSEWVQAYNQLMRTGAFARCWFRASMKACAKEAGCNYTTIGGIFERLGYAQYEPGVYRRLATPRGDLPSGPAIVRKSRAADDFGDLSVPIDPETSARPRAPKG